jgi:acylphosphatase
VSAPKRQDTIQWTRIRFARNEKDGSVTLEIEGPSTKVDALVEWARTGPEGARVDNVVVLKINPTYVRAPFEIKT